MRLLRWVLMWALFKRFRWAAILLSGGLMAKRYLDDRRNPQRM